MRIAVSTFGNELLDPAGESGTTFSELLLPIYDTVLGISPEGEIAPGLAEEWSLSEDGQTWTFKIREGVQFHGDWGELSAEDVAFSLERWGTEEAAAAGAEEVREMVSDVRVVDERTVEVQTNGVQTGFLYALTPHQTQTGAVFSKKYLTEEGGDDFQAQSDLLNERPIGTGPFQFASRAAGDRLTLEAVDDHWRTTPEIDVLEYLLVPEPATQAAMLLGGEVDIINVTGDQIARVEGAGMEVRSIPNSLPVGLMFHGTYRSAAEGKPTTSPDVRHALSLAIDREGILESLFAGRGSLPTTPWFTLPSTQDVEPGAYSALMSEATRYDPEAARAMLQDAGYPPESTDFGDITMHVFSRPGSAPLPQIGEIIVAQWSDIGVNMPISQTDYGTFRDHMVRAEDSDAYNAGDPSPWSAGPRFDALGAMSSYFRTDASVELLNDEEFDALFDQIAAEPDDSARESLVEEAFQIVLDSWVSLSLFNVDTLFAVNPDRVGEWQAIEGFGFLGPVVETISVPD